MGPEEQSALRNKLQSARQKPGEPATTFLARIVLLMNLINPHQEEHDRVLDIRGKLLNSYQARIVGIRVATLDELSDLCHEIEEHWEKAAQFREARGVGQPVSKAKNAGPVVDKKGTTEASKKPQKRKPRPSYHCDFCGKDGHSDQRCWAKHGKPEKAVAVTEEEDNDYDNPTVTTESVSAVIALVGKSEGIFHQVHLNDVPMEAMLDTGSNLSLLREDAAQALNLILKPTEVKLISADCKEIQCMGEAKLNLAIVSGQTRKFADVKFIVVKNLCVRVLIGMIIKGAFEIVLRTNNRTIAFGDAQEVKGGCGTRLRLMESVQLNQRCQQTAFAVDG